MKAIITLIFVLFIGVTASAQGAKNETVVNIENVEVVTVKEVVAKKENNVARLYKFKNSKIKKALSFSSKKNKSKLA